MATKMILRVVASIFLAVPAVAQAAIYSPTQDEFLDMVYVDFINDDPDEDIAAVDSITAVGDDSVEIQFDVDFDADDNLYRVAMENIGADTGFALDLTPYDSFNITFTSPESFDGLPIAAQIFVRSVGGNVFTSTSSLTLSPTFPITLTLPKQTIINSGGDPADITGFGIEFFADEFITIPAGQMNLQVTASTSPQPPTLEDHLLYSFEDGFDGWITQQGTYMNGSTPHPDHTHALSATGATEGTQALRIDRAVTGNALPGTSGSSTGDFTFRWGSQLNLDANAGGGGAPQGDYNEDGKVSAADFTTWRANLGAATLPNRDPDNTGSIDSDDFDSWKENYGEEGGGPDPEILAEIGEIIDLINDPDAYSISFDLRIEDHFPDPNPAWANFFLVVQSTDADTPGDGDDGWYQSQQVDVPGADLAGLASGTPVEVTIDFPLTQFDDANDNGIQSLADGLDPEAQYLNFVLATNYPIEGAPLTYTIYIDNFRIRHIVPEEGSGLGSSVPEPSSALLAGLALLFGGVLSYRKK